jgi:hypothetical protein
MSSKGKKTEQAPRKRAFKVAEVNPEEVSLEDPPAEQANEVPDDPIEEPSESDKPVVVRGKRKAEDNATEVVLDKEASEELYKAMVTLGNFVETNNFGLLKQEVLKCNQLLAKKPKGQGAVYASMNRIWMQIGVMKEQRQADHAEVAKIKDALRDLYTFKRGIEPEFDRTKGMTDRTYSYMKWLSEDEDRGGKGFKQPPKPINGSRGVGPNEIKGQEWLFGAPDVDQGY